MKEIDLIMEMDGKVSPIEIKKSANPSRHLTNVFKVIDKTDFKRGTGGIICMANELSAFDSDNLIIPVSLI